jgi:hypothetical protein
VIFFYELLFVVVAVVAVAVGEIWSRTLAVVLLATGFALAMLGQLSVSAGLAQSTDVGATDRRWATDARDGLRHLALLFGLATLAALVWRVVAG